MGRKKKAHCQPIKNIRIYFFINSCCCRRFCSLVLQVASWSATVENATTTSLAVSWQNLAALMGQRIFHYFVLIKSKNGGVLNGNILSANTNFDVIRGLSTYTEYQLSIVGVGDNGTAYSSNELAAWTDEGGKDVFFHNVIILIF